MSIDAADFAELVDQLTGGTPTRTWSLIVTIFGDLAQAPGTWISAATLQAITASLGIKPEATRTALHRLRKDDWLVSRRDGRRSDYALSPQGRRLSAAASPRIYGPAPEGPWFLSIHRNNTHQGATQHNAVAPIAPNILLSPQAEPDALNLPLAEIELPGWMREAVCDAALLEMASLTHIRLSAAEDAPLNKATPLQVASLRVLIVHSWRRLVLKAPALPDDLFPAQWQGGACRKVTHDLLDRLPRPTLDALNQTTMAV